ncbi:MAG TPA: ParB N-terminal domain-containing protein [Armatimonadota bacterium]|mgnify:CR=1 FL=1|nr:ParB N-terminal domain-containing protein [Armatimonadota bacterium]
MQCKTAINQELPERQVRSRGRRRRAPTPRPPALEIPLDRVFLYHEALSALPTGNVDEFALLKRSIESIGQLVPILVWDGVLIDGRRRLLACRELGIEPLVQPYPNDAHTDLWTRFEQSYFAVLELNKGRLSEVQHAFAAAEVLTMVQRLPEARELVREIEAQMTGG